MKLLISDVPIGNTSLWFLALTFFRITSSTPSTLRIVIYTAITFTTPLKGMDSK